MANGFLLRSRAFTASQGVSSGAVQSGTSYAFLANDFMGMTAQAATASRLHVLADLGASPGAVDTIALLNLICPSPASIEVRADNSSANWATAAFSSGAVSLPSSELANASGFKHFNLLLSSPQTYRYWWVYVELLSGVQIQASRLLLGSRYQPARNFSFGVQRGARDLGEVEFGGRGALLRRRGKKLRPLGLGWGFLTKAEAETQALPFLEAVGNTEFVLACLDPDPDAERSRRLYFGPIEGNLGVTWFANGLFEKRLQIASVI